jgi:uncharacterized membrane protein YjdF
VTSALPPSGLRAVVYCATSLVMVVAIVIGTRRWRPSSPMAWYLMAFGQLLFTIGDAYSFFYEWVAFYPGVPREEVGFRIQVTAANTDDEVTDLLVALDRLADLVPLRPI